MKFPPAWAKFTAISSNTDAAKPTANVYDMTPTHDLPRRRFLKTFALTTVYTGACGSLGKFFLAEVQAQSVPAPGIFQADITVSPFTPLQNVNGSVNVRIPGTPTTFPAVIITRTATSQFFAVTSRCTHAGCTVGTLNLTTMSLNCPCHGSRFSPAGAVVQGPAALALQSYANTFDGNRVLRIEIPNLAYSVTAAVVPVANVRRIRLVFRSVLGSRYDVRFRENFESGTESVLPFSTTPNGVAIQTVISGTGGNLTLYVEPPATTGFYSIATFL